MPWVTDLWPQIVALEDPDIRLRALRAERLRLFELREDAPMETAALLDLFIDAVGAARKARRLAAGPQTDWAP